jgi:ParB family chromosome partitioning protein
MSDKTGKNRGLGRGLSALMADVTPDRSGDAPRRPDRSLPVEALRPNPAQPRRSFDETELNELADSIREKGVIQPLIVRPDPSAEGRYEIVAGERRWRAAQRAQLHEVPVIIRDYTDTEVLEVAIIENIQRTDLNAIDEASAYRQLMERFGHTQDQLATVLGKSRSHVANQMRLLTLPEEVQGHVVQGRLTAGHSPAVRSPTISRCARSNASPDSPTGRNPLPDRPARPPRTPTHSSSKASFPPRSAWAS